VLFADLKGSMELLADRDPEEARSILDPVLARMMEAVHRHKGTVNQVMGDGQTMAALDGARRWERFGAVFLPAVHSRAWLAWCYVELGAFAEGKTLGDEGLRIAEAVEHPGSLMVASLGFGLLALRQGDLPRALPLLERAVGICRDADLAYALHLLGDVAAHRKPPETEQAEAHYHQALALAEKLGMRPLQAHCHRSLGTLYAMTGQRAQARAELDTAITLYCTMDMTFWLPQAEAALTQVDT
jgi:tetratricopeptide (TPR) repeat protein